jgi:hypothetical protein
VRLAAVAAAVPLLHNKPASGAHRGQPARRRPRRTAAQQRHPPFFSSALPSRIPSSHACARSLRRAARFQGPGGRLGCGSEPERDHESDPPLLGGGRRPSRLPRRAHDDNALLACLAAGAEVTVTVTVRSQRASSRVTHDGLARTVQPTS